MYIFKKTSLSILIILLLFSLYNDFTKDSQTESLNVQKTSLEIPEKALRVKFQRGDTFISVSEKINGNHISKIPIEELVADFEKVNGNVHVHSLKVGDYYYFPIYEKN